MKRPPSNIAASVRARLLNIRTRTGEDYNALLTRYADFLRSPQMWW